MKVAPGSTDVTTYFKLVDPASGVPETGLTITDLDATYVRDRAAAVKADLTALAAADDAHADNKAIQVDATNAPGLYRVDWPDAAFAAGVSRVQLVVNGAAIDPAVIEVELETPQTGDAYARLGAPAGASVSADIADLPTVTEFNARTLAAADYTVVTDLGTVQTGDAYAVVNHADYGNAKLVRSTVPANTLDVDASGNVTLAATQVADVADAVWDEAIAGHAAAGSTGEALADAATGGGLSAQEVRDALKLAPTAGAPAAGSVDAHLDDILTDTGTTLPADVWAYTTRTLTSTAAATTAAVTGAQLNIGITASYAATLTGLTIPATWTKIWFTTKKQLDDADASAALQIVVSNPAAGATDGVLYVEGAAASAAQRTLGSLTINQAGGTVAIAIDETLTASLLPRGGEYYDIKCLESGGACTILTEGRAAVGRTVTRAVA